MTWQIYTISLTVAPLFCCRTITIRFQTRSKHVDRLTVGVLVTETLVRFFALSLDMATSAWSALSSDSSSSFCALRYLARLSAASSSCNIIRSLKHTLTYDFLKPDYYLNR